MQLEDITRLISKTFFFKYSLIFQESEQINHLEIHFDSSQTKNQHSSTSSIPDEFFVKLEHFNRKFNVTYTKVKRDAPTHPIADNHIYTLDSNSKPNKFHLDNQEVSI